MVPHKASEIQVSERVLSSRGAGLSCVCTSEPNPGTSRFPSARRHHAREVLAAQGTCAASETPTCERCCREPTSLHNEPVFQLTKLRHTLLFRKDKNRNNLLSPLIQLLKSAQINCAF